MTPPLVWIFPFLTCPWEDLGPNDCHCWFRLWPEASLLPSGLRMPLSLFSIKTTREILLELAKHCQTFGQYLSWLPTLLLPLLWDTVCPWLSMWLSFSSSFKYYSIPEASLSSLHNIVPDSPFLLNSPYNPMQASFNKHFLIYLCSFFLFFLPRSVPSPTPRMHW